MYVTREWRNWQTRTFEGRVVTPYGFKSRLSHHAKKQTRKSLLFCMVRMKRASRMKTLRL